MIDEPVPSARVRGGAPVLGRAPSSDAPPPGVTVIPMYPMYSPGQATGATFLGGPLAGAWVLAANYRRLGERAKVRATLLVGVLATVALLAFAFAVTNSASSCVAIVPVIAVASLAKSLQGAAYDRHRSLGGAGVSTWRVVGVGLASLAITLGAVFAVALGGTMLTRPDSIRFGESEVLYTDGATAAEARAVGEQLTQLQYFRPDNPADVEVRRVSGRHVVAFVVQDFVFEDHDTQLAISEMAEPLSKAAFGGAPVDLWLCDAELAPHVKLPWSQRPRHLDLGEGHVVAYRDGGTEAEARGVAHVLEERQYFAPSHPATVVVQRDPAGRHVVAFVLGPTGFGNATVRTDLYRYAEAFSKEAFGGAPVDLWLNDTHRVTHERLRWEARPR